MKSEKIIFIVAFIALAFVAAEFFFKFYPQYVPFNLNNQFFSRRNIQAGNNKIPDPNAWYLYKNNDGDKSFSFFYPASYEVEETKNKGEKTVVIYAKAKNDRVKLMTLTYVISENFKAGSKTNDEQVQWLIASRYDKKRAYIKVIIFDPYFNIGDSYYETTRRISYSVQTM